MTKGRKLTLGFLSFIDIYPIHMESVVCPHTSSTVKRKQTTTYYNKMKNKKIPHCPNNSCFRDVNRTKIADQSARRIFNDIR